MPCAIPRAGRSLARGVVILPLIAAMACNDSGPVAPEALALAAPANGPLFLGQLTRLVLTSAVDGAVITAAPTRWSVGDTTVARVNAAGTVAGVGLGTTQVFAELEGNRVQVTVRVIARFVDNGTLLQSASVGEGANCALRADGVPVCLAVGTVDAGSVMTPWIGAGGPRFTTVNTARSHRCGLTDNGTMYCAGVNVSGQLANSVTSTAAVAVPLITGGGIAYRGVSTGGSEFNGFTCAIRAQDSVVVCAGRNALGETGHVPTETSDSLFLPVTGNFKALSVSTGRAHACAVATDSSLYCWGRNDHDLLGTPSSALFSTNVPTRINSGLTFASVSSGSHSCAVSAAGDLYCWGSNASGQLGIGAIDTLPHAFPQKVIIGSSVTAVLAANGFTCAITTTGVLYCWGAALPLASEYQTMLTAQPGVPMRLGYGIAFRSISADPLRICGVSTEGRGMCL